MEFKFTLYKDGEIVGYERHYCWNDGISDRISIQHCKTCDFMVIHTGFILHDDKRIDNIDLYQVLHNVMMKILQGAIDDPEIKEAQENIRIMHVNRIKQNKFKIELADEIIAYFDTPQEQQADAFVKWVDRKDEIMKKIKDLEFENGQ